MDNKSKKKGEVWPVASANVGSESFVPIPLKNKVDNQVNFSIVPDDPAYQPVFTEGGLWLKVFAKLPTRTSLTHRAILTLDCGISLSLSPGFSIKAKPTLELAAKGLLVNAVTLIGDRVRVIVTNIGKEILVLEDRQVFACLSAEPSYFLTIG